jgi:hypothetical protein
MNTAAAGKHPNTSFVLKHVISVVFPVYAEATAWPMKVGLGEVKY